MRRQVPPAKQRRNPPAVRTYAEPARTGSHPSGPPRAKERADQRRKRRRRKTILFYTLLFFLVIAIAVILSFTVLFRMETISVEGSSRYSQEEIVEASGLKKGENLFRLDLETASLTLETALPYIGNAKIRRKLPDGVVIYVEEAQPAGAVEYEGRSVLIDGGGKVLELVSESPQELPVIKGIAVSQAQPGQPLEYEEEEKSETLQLLLEALEETALSPVTEIDLSDTFNLVAVYDGRIRLELGVSTDLPEKIRFFKDGILPSGQIAETTRGTLDLSLVPKNNKGYFSEEIASSLPPELDASSSETSGESAPDPGG